MGNVKNGRKKRVEMKRETIFVKNKLVSTDPQGASTSTV